MPIFPSFFVNKTGAYEIEQSLRFNSGDSTKLSRTFSSDNSNANFTVSFWCKRGELAAYNSFIAAQTDASNYEHWMWYNNDSIGSSNGVSGTANNNQSTAVFRDPSAWYHVVWKNVASGATTVHVNGTQVLSFTRQHKAVNKNVNHNIGVGADNGSFRANFYLAEYHLVDGSALDPTEFAEYDDNGVWRPIEYTGSYGTNGFYLKFDETATNGIGHDHSGNGNNWTASGFTTSGTGTDVMSDTPTTNWCTLNPNYKAVSGATFSEGNLKVTYPSAPPTGMHVGTLATTNAFYVEAKATAATSNQIYLGVETPERGNINNNYPGGGPDGWGYGMNGRIYNNGSTVTDTGTTYTTNDVIGIACNPSSGTIQFFKNGTSVYSGTSVANVPLTICVSQSGGSGNSGTIEINCGQRAFEQTAPSGFSPLNTANLPAPTIKDGSEYFNTVLYTGDNTNQAITGVGFQPDWVWIKSRSSISDHVLQDAVRGVQKFLISNNTSSEDTDSGTITSFDSDGFTIGSGNNKVAANNSGETFAAWNWLAGGSGSSNTNGSITSTVSANPSAGFSIVAYTGNGSNSQTVGHGLGVAPRMCIGKSRGSNSWFIRHESLGSNLNLNFNDSGTVTPGGGGLIGDLTSSTTISLPGGSNAGSGNMNANGTNYIMYCFAEVEGYSKFGSYTGNGSSDGPFVYCGFRPAWVMIKATAGTGNSWYISDNKRNTYNVVDGRLMANLNNGESTSVDICDFTANGFKIRTNDSGWNTSGTTYVFASFSENPFGGDGVSPATAR